ncbi:MAG: ferritin-like domain-containing protein [Myxococcales bacterium]|nr:ferritin-like domain-containing protein [Myxococcales bacterium]
MAMEIPPAIAEEWLRRTSVEYTSAALTQELTLWLIQVGASPDLVRAGLRIVDDELVHAELAFAAARAAGATGGPALIRERLRYARREALPLEHDLFRYCFATFCMGETLAVRIFSAMREGASAPAARAALDRILVDEVRHRDFGWTLLAWLCDASPAAAQLRAQAPAEIAERLEQWSHRYEGGEGDPPLGPEEVAWGLLHRARARAIYGECLARDIMPRLRRLGLAPASAATRASTQA